MPRYPKEPTFRYWIYDTKQGKEVDFTTLPPEAQEEIKIRNYQTFLKALGAVPVTKPKKSTQ